MRTGFTKKHPPKTTWHKGKLYGTFYRKFHAFGGLFGQQSVSDQSSAVAHVILKYVSIVSRGIAKILGGGGGSQCKIQTYQRLQYNHTHLTFKCSNMFVYVGSGFFRTNSSYS